MQGLDKEYAGTTYYALILIVRLYARAQVSYGILEAV